MEILCTDFKASSEEAWIHRQPRNRLEVQWTIETGQHCVHLFCILANWRRYLLKKGFLSKTVWKPSLCKLQKATYGLPWWCSGWESACQCRGHGFEPWSGRIPHAVEQLGPWATTTEPACIWSLCSTTREATIVTGPRTVMKSGPRSPQLEKALAQKWRSNTAKNK